MSRVCVVVFIVKKALTYKRMMCYFLLQNNLEITQSQNREQKIGLMQLNMSISKQLPHILKKGLFFCRSHEVVFQAI